MQDEAIKNAEYECIRELRHKLFAAEDALARAQTRWRSSHFWTGLLAGMLSWPVWVLIRTFMGQ